MQKKTPQYVLYSLILTVGLACQKQVLTTYVTTPYRRVELTTDPSQPGIRIPSDFNGLSFEKGILPGALYLNANNAVLINLIKHLGTQGVIRIGGNSVENVFWAGRGRDGSTDVDSMYTDDVIHFFEFVRATGWRTLYGVNLAQSTNYRTAAEAAYAQTTGGTYLEAFEIGNEPDLYATNGLKASTYSFANFQYDWQSYYTAIRTATATVTPTAAFAGPGTADKYSTWLLPFISAEAQQAHRLFLATHHYYRMGPPSDPSVTVQKLLTSDPALTQELTMSVAASRSAGIPFRVAECNSVYDGGKKGVSNTFASTLWGLDYMYTLATMGVAGVNFHGGTGGYYSPILLTKSSAQAQPLYYALLCFQLGCQGRVLPVTLSTPGSIYPTLSAYAVLASDGTTMLTLINKDNTYNADFTIHTGTTLTSANYTELRAPSLYTTSASNITLGGAIVKSDGSFAGPHYSSLPHTADSVQITVQAASAMVVLLK